MSLSGRQPKAWILSAAGSTAQAVFARQAGSRTTADVMASGARATSEVAVRAKTTLYAGLGLRLVWLTETERLWPALS